MVKLSYAIGSFLLITIFLQSAKTSEIVEEDEVAVLTESNFNDFVGDNNVVLVEFYAPWCGHCKKLAPEFSAAAKFLKSATHPVLLGKVDATVHTELASKFEVSGYPTLKIFKGDVDNPTDYDGGRTRDEIVATMNSIADPNYVPPPSDVLVLTSSNFSEVVENEKLILVEFYAPWCGHCKKLAPEYEKAATQLISDNIKLAKVDATAETDLAQTYDVSGYPTLKLFRKGRAFEFKGERNQYGIIEELRKQAQPASTVVVSFKEFRKLIDVFDETVLGIFKSEGSEEFQHFIDLANKYRDIFTFRHSFDRELITYLNLKNFEIDSVAIFHPKRFHSNFEQSVFVLKNPKTVLELEDFLKLRTLPLVGQLTLKNRGNKYESLPLCVIFYDVNFSFDHYKATQFWRNKVIKVATKFPELRFAVADEVEFSEDLAASGLADSSEEINVIIYGKDGRKYPLYPDDEFSENVLIEFIQKWNNNKLKPHLKSQKSPKKQTVPLTVVGNTFDEIVLDTSKHVLIEFYAPWCGHCKQLEPIYKRLAEAYKDNPEVVIAKMDATANDLHSQYQVNGFPTIYWASKNSKITPLLYSKDRTFEGFDDFIKEQLMLSREEL